MVCVGMARDRPFCPRLQRCKLPHCRAFTLLTSIAMSYHSPARYQTFNACPKLVTPVFEMKFMNSRPSSNPAYCLDIALVLQKLTCALHKSPIPLPDRRVVRHLLQQRVHGIDQWHRRWMRGIVYSIHQRVSHSRRHTSAETLANQMIRRI